MNLRKHNAIFLKTTYYFANIGAVICIFLAACYADVIYKGVSEHAFSAVYSRATWQPGRSYSSQIESGLAVLAEYAPAQAAFVRQYGMPISLTRNLSRGINGLTSEDTGEILVREFSGETSEQIAAIIYHELVHVQAGLHNPEVYEANIAKRILTRNEEAIAHMRTLMFLEGHKSTFAAVEEWAIYGGWPHGRAGLAAEYVLYYWPLGTFLAFLLPCVPLLMLARWVSRIAYKYAAQASHKSYTEASDAARA